jgi:hypothetical protein
MNKTNLGIMILLGISILGVIGLVAIDKTTDVIVPIMTALLGLLAGVNKEVVAGIFKK